VTSVHSLQRHQRPSHAIFLVHIPPTDHKNGLLADQTEVVHSVDDGQHSGHGLVLLTAGHDEGCQRNVVMLEVCLPLLRVEARNGGVANQEHALPRSIDVGEVTMLGVEDVIDKLETLVAKSGSADIIEYVRTDRS
jgi:hypothetical protein